MASSIVRQPDQPLSLTRAALAGLSGGGAYLAVQAVDIALFRDPTDDLKLLGMVVTRRAPWWWILGLTGHFGFSVVLATAYAVGWHRWFRWPAPLRGLALALTENTVLWFAFIKLIDRWHPAIRSGLLPRYNRPVSFVQQLLRHVAFGLVLGAVYGDRKDRR